MTNRILTLQKAGRLTCAWVPTGNPRNPLACVWAETAVRVSAKAAPSSNDNSGRMPRCA
jgi:hypothetical protein